MTVEKIEIVITGDARKGTQAVRDYDKSLGNLGDKTQALQGNMLAATAVVGAFAVALREGYKQARGAAELEFTAGKFDRLAESIGTSGDVLLEKVEAATQGLLSQADQMEVVTEILALGLVETEDEAVRLTNVISQLNMDTNELVLTLTNQTTKRFDQLGVSLTGFDQKLKDLESQGYSTEKAFTLAFLEQAEGQIERVGSVADTSLGSFMRWEAATEDLSNSIKQKLIPVFTPLVEGLTKVVEAQEKINEADAQEIIADLESISDPYERYLTQLEYEWDLKNDMRSAGVWRLRQLYEEGNLTREVADSYGILTPAVHASLEMYADYEARIESTLEPVEDMADAQFDLADAMDAANLSLDSQIGKWRDQITFLEGGGAAIELVAQQIRQDYIDGLISAEEAHERLALKQMEFMTLMGDFDNLSVEQIAGRIQDLGFDLSTAELFAAGIYAQLQNIDGANVDATIDIVTKYHGGKLPAGVSVSPSGNLQFETNSGYIEMRQHGGPVEKGRPYWVGEGGVPELFIPDQSGQIIPPDDFNGGGSYAGFGGGPEQIIINYSPVISLATRQEFEESIFPLIDRAMRKRERGAIY